MVESRLAQNFENEYEVMRINERYSIIHVPAERFDMCALGNYPYHIFPTIYTLNSVVSLEESGIISVQSNINLSLFGQGVLIGIVDTGIDYVHEAFLNADGSTRLFSIWDQTVESGEPPIDFQFGSEYNKTQINIALRESDPYQFVPSIDENGHGTMMAGIAAGTENKEENFRGVASESELVVVKLAPAKQLNKAIFNIGESILCYPETNILLGIEYVMSVAQRLNRPMVLCIGIGSSQGDHDGHDALSMQLNSFSTYPRIGVCIAAGNEGDKRRHYRGASIVDQPFSKFELHVGESDKMFSMQIWQKSPSRLAIQLESPLGEWTEPVYPKLNSCIRNDFVFDNSRVYINNILLEEETGEQLILLRFEYAFSGSWSIRLINIDNIYSYFDAWLPAGDIISDQTYFMESNPDITVTSPGNARNPLTVTAYDQLRGSILISSSRGFTASNGVVPDVSAPGFELPCPIPIRSYGMATGTGAACAHAAGIIAMLLEWAVLRGNYTTITGRDISRLIIRGARRKSTISYPNTVWGYGQIDIMGVFRSLT